MNGDICIAVNTTSKNKDLWKMFYGQFKKHFPQRILIYTLATYPVPNLLAKLFCMIKI